MRASYGFKDGSGDWFLFLDLDKCNGCGDCVEACPVKLFEVGENEYDPFSEESVARVKDDHRKKLRYSCAPCQPGYGVQPPPCVAVCEPGAISHSAGWKLAYGH
jgi:ferredoxin